MSPFHLHDLVINIAGILPTVSLCKCDEMQKNTYEN